MANQRRWLRPLAILALLVVVPILIMPLVPLDFLKPAVESKLSQKLGRKVEVGSLRLSLWGGPYLTITGMTAKEDPAFGTGDFLKAEKVKADFAVFRYLFKQEVSIESLEIASPEFTLIKNRDGVWSWTTVGGNTGAPGAAAGSLDPPLAWIAPALMLQAQARATGTALRKVDIVNGSVRLIDQSADQPTEGVYNNINLHAEVEPAADKGPDRATGELRADSGESTGGEILKASLPFDLKIGRDESGALLVDGTVGPGPFATANFVANSFTLTTKLGTEPARPAQTRGAEQAASAVRGQGHISAGGVVLPRINVSEQVAQAVQLNGIGDMNPGTTISNLETDFQIDRGLYKTTGMRITQLDGLGDASADQGSFKLAPALTLDYAATITLSDEATAQVKSMSPLAGWVALIQNSNRLSVAFNIMGDIRSPQVRVDLAKTLGF